MISGAAASEKDRVVADTNLGQAAASSACIDACMVVCADKQTSTNVYDAMDRRVCNSPPRSVAPSAASGASVIQHFELAFQLEKDSLRFQMFTIIACAFACLYNLAGCCMFFSSLYPVPVAWGGNGTDTTPRKSAVDSLLMTSHVFAIDATSAIFVVTGFFAAYIFANVPPNDRFELCKMFAMYVVIDVWLVGCLALLAGSVFHLIRLSFRAQDVALTVIESLLCLRALELQQGNEQWHSMNPTAWPVLCCFWATILTPLTLAGNERLRRCHAGAEVVVPWINASGPILVISLFALVHDNSNIFYINASHVGYRVLEFNLGICIYSSMITWPLSFWRVALVISFIAPYVLACFVMLWWAELGQPVSVHTGTCIRMYNFCPCIKMHHGFLMRGCFLGATLVCRVVTSSEDAMRKVAACWAPSQAHALTAAMVAVLLTWPCCYVVHTILEINFGLQLVRDNAALLMLCVPHVAFALALLWDTSWKPRVFLLVESVLESALRVHAT